jgi:hypothetical protein
VSCDAVIAAFELTCIHCESCHQDYDMGDPMCTIIADDGCELAVCCDVANALEAKGITDEEVHRAITSQSALAR